MTQTTAQAFQTSSPSAAAPSGTRFGEFFRYHGWLAPGVRLFRVIGFRAKASWLAMAMLVPLAMMLAFLWSSAQEQISFANAERQGLTYVRPALALLVAAQERRQTATAKPAADLTTHQDKVKAAFATVQARHDELGTGFEDGQAFAALLKAHQGLLQTPVAATPDETTQAHNAFADALLALINQIANGSKLALDPDLDTYHLMNMSVLRGPLQYDNTARLRGIGGQVLTTKTLTPLHQVWINKLEGQLELIDRDIKNSYHEGIERDPALAKGFDMQHAGHRRDGSGLHHIAQATGAWHRAGR